MKTILFCLLLLSGGAFAPIPETETAQHVGVDLDSLRHEMSNAPMVRAVNTRFTAIEFQITANGSDLEIINERINSRSRRVKPVSRAVYQSPDISGD